MVFRRAIMQGNFDSVLEPAQPGRTAKLTIRLKVALLPRDPSVAANPRAGQHPTHLANNMTQVRRGSVPDANGDPVACRSWLVHEWNAFKIQFKRIVEQTWDNQMILLPPDGTEDGLNDNDFLQLIGNPRIPAHVECALDIELMPGTAGSHAQIGVVHLASPDLSFRNFMHLISNDSAEMGSRVKDQWPGRRIYHVTAAHEVGHWLRDPSAKLYEHIDRAYAETLPADEQDDAQYGHVLSKRLAIMGSGNLATEYEAQPWLGRIRRHTGALFGWSMVHRANFAHMISTVSGRQQRLAQQPRI